jgi:zona occludens toxin
MIKVFTGTPGSFKSYHVAKLIWERIRTFKQAVIYNYPINVENLTEKTWSYWLRKIFRKMKPRYKKNVGRLEIWPNHEMTVSRLEQYAIKNHVEGKEGQTLVIIDECGIKFNTKTADRRDRLRWIEFFSRHRHYGFNFILVTQDDRMIDRQIRSLCEYNCVHRALSNYGTLGWILTLIFGKSSLSLERWYGGRMITGREFFFLNKRIASIYNTFQMFKEKAERPQPGSAARSAAGGSPVENVIQEGA